ncbi:hypothetical protein HMPREF1008_00704 [Olsenella sp. oral taxon 809 str. F0356]|uniref:SIR2 family NAD-dependent protein deacylase n=1 Tax=Olsenella sp. oral taxon 809 TaxID=661086 RepID=UPI000231F316|nr:hypothetical protein [Olsenella sp. oral taxon 809]EHF02299.1 hypothetical protein HMPREF1008_00704 [Olsenella sp. oral taxon 809 str. F0356]
MPMGRSVDVRWATRPTGSTEDAVGELARRIREADAVLVGAGAGLSAACGPEFDYSGERFLARFGDFHERFGITDLYSGGFYPFPGATTRWAWWSRHVWYARYDCPVGEPYRDLVALLRGREHFVLTTNVDHQFQRAGVDRERLFYTQGDYGLWQCSVPCHDETYDNYEVVRQMVELQSDLRVPEELVPRCPRCGEEMSMNLRADSTFVEDAGWHAAAGRYRAFLDAHEGDKVVYLEVGVGNNTPGIIKYPFWKLAAQNPRATYAQVNATESLAPAALGERAILIRDDAARVLAGLRAKLAEEA